MAARQRRRSPGRRLLPGAGHHLRALASLRARRGLGSLGSRRVGRRDTRVQHDYSRGRRRRDSRSRSRRRHDQPPAGRDVLRRLFGGLRRPRRASVGSRLQPPVDRYRGRGNQVGVDELAIAHAPVPGVACGMRTLILASAILVVLAVPAAASADSIALSPTPAPAGQPIPVAVTTSVTVPPGSPPTTGFVFVYAAPNALPCAPTPQAEATAPSVMPLATGYPVTGDSTYNLTFFPPGPGSYSLCGYLVPNFAGPPTATTATVLNVAALAPQIAPPDLTDGSDTPTRTRTRTKNAAGELFSRLHHHMFGTDPLPITVGAAHKAANGDSGGAAVSGDNRKTRLAAFHSSATNLMAGDSNGVKDVFVWQRPRGTLGLVLNRLGGALKRVSVSASGK